MSAQNFSFASPGDGEYEEKERQKAVELIHRSADLGNEQAQETMGKFYMTGWLVPQNEELGASYYKKAADNGNHEAQIAYARFLWQGVGVKADKVDAERYIEMARQSNEESIQKSAEEAWEKMRSTG